MTAAVVVSNFSVASVTAGRGHVVTPADESSRHCPPLRKGSMSLSCRDSELPAECCRVEVA